MIAVMKTDLTRCLGGTFIIVIILIGVLCSVFLVDKTPNNYELSELKQVHVIFSHGERTPTLEEVQMFPLSVNHNETYSPYGFGALTNEGKIRMFEMGAKLRELYNDFLGQYYDVNSFKIQTINTDVCKMSALLVLAGVWPSQTDELWNINSWQPIPYKTVREQSDFLNYEVNCPRFEREKRLVSQEYMSHNDLPYQEFFELLDMYTGSNITEFSQVVKLTEFMEAQRLFTNSTPRWYKNLEKMINNVLVTEKKLKYQKPLMKEFSSGYLFKKVYYDSKNEVEQALDNAMYCYSADTHSIAGLLADTNLKRTNPKLGSMFIVEMYSTVSEYNEYIYKFLYYDGESPTLSTVQLNKCLEPCFVYNFKDFISKTIQKDYETECNT